MPGAAQEAAMAGVKTPRAKTPRAKTPGGAARRREPAPRAKSAASPGLLTRVERVARSIGVELPRAPKGGAPAANAATEAAGFLATDGAARAARPASSSRSSGPTAP
jgi:hypothetical protein